MPTAQQKGLPSAPVKQKPKPQPEATSEHSYQPPAPVAQPPRAPIPALMNVGFFGGIEDFNRRVEQIVNAHQRELGVIPTPALTLDIARADVPDDVIPRLFRGHATPGATRAVRQEQEQDPAFGGAQMFGNETGVFYEAHLLKGLEQAGKGGRQQLDKYLHENAADLQELYKDPKNKDLLIKAMLTAGGNAHLIDQKDVPGELYGATGGRMGALPYSDKGFDLLSFAAKATAQIAEGLTIGPALATYEEGRAAYHDIGAVAHGNAPTHLVKANVKLGKMAWQGLNYDLENPGQNPGYLFLDALGLAGAAGSAVARIGRAARAETVEGTVNALARRPTPGTVTLHKGGHTEQALLSENPTVALVQRMVAGVKNKRMQQRFDGTDMPAGLAAIARPFRANQVLDKLLDPSTSPLSGEASLRREMQARKRTEQVLLMEPRRELDRAAGWSVNSAPVIGHVLGRLPAKARKGLTVGEQKAIQILATDDPSPVESWRSFHERMIEWGIGNPANHRAQLAAIGLAEKALEHPSPRFKEALRLTAEVVERQEQIKKDQLGLNPETADRRVIAYGEVVRTGKPVDELALPNERQVEGSFYLPAFSKGKGPARVSERGPYFEMREAGKGYTPSRDLPELRHEFTGNSIRSGDFRIDATNLAGETYARTVRLATIRSDHANLWSAATKTPRSAYDRPIRNTSTVPGKLKKVLDDIDQGEITGRELDQLHPEQVDELFKFLYPGKQLKDGRWVFPEAVGDDVRWVSAQHLESFRPPLRTKAKLIGQLINEPIRDITLFARLAYALNAVSNAGMLVLHQGHHAPPNMIRAIFARHLYSDKVTDTLDALVGQSKSRSFAPDFDHALLKAGRFAANVWNKVADQAFRRAAIIYELERKGFKGQDGLERALFDKTHLDAVNEARRRANKAMVEFDNLTWYEREVLRNYIFVYPWVSRSLVWSIRSIVEHPVKADILAQIGHTEQAEHPEIFDRAPEWFKQIGYVPVGTDGKGAPKVINPTSINVFTTLQQTVGLTNALTATGGESTAFNNAAGLAGPFATFAVHTFTGRDDYGNPYPGPDMLGAAKDVLLNLPQESAYRRANRENKPEKTIDVADRRTLVERENAALHRSVFSPGWLGGYGMLLSGGLTDRAIDPEALTARYWAQQPPAARYKHQMQLVRKALKIQAELLQTPVPATVTEAVNLAGKRTFAYQQESKKRGRTPTAKEQAATDIRIYAEAHKLTPEHASTLLKQLKALHDPMGVDRFKTMLTERYGNGAALREWDSDVRLVASFNKNALTAKINVLKTDGVADVMAATADQETLYEAGRRALAYVHESRRRIAELDNDPTRTADKAALTAWQDTQDHPIKINGKVVAPSPVRLTWASQTDKERDNHLAAAMNADWGDLSNFDKQLLGKKVPAGISAAWAEIERAKVEYRKANPGSNIKPEQLLATVKMMEKYYPQYRGILQDYLFSRKPKIFRFEVEKPYLTMPGVVRRMFDSFVAPNVKTVANAIASGDYKKGYLRGVWKNYVADNLLPWLREPEQKSLWAWLDAHGGTTLLNTLPG